MVADLIATLPNSDETHSPLKDVENSYVHFQYDELTEATGFLLQAIRKFYNYISGGGMQYVDRGDPANVDFSIGDFTTDGNWHDLDLSSIVPTGVNSIHFRVIITDDVAGSVLMFRKKGNTNERNIGAIRTQVANVNNESDFFITPDSNRIIQYKTSAVTFSLLNFIVRGWIT